MAHARRRTTPPKVERGNQQPHKQRRIPARQRMAQHRLPDEPRLITEPRGSIARPAPRLKPNNAPSHNDKSASPDDSHDSPTSHRQKRDTPHYRILLSIRRRRSPERQSDNKPRRRNTHGEVINVVKTQGVTVPLAQRKPAVPPGYVGSALSRAATRRNCAAQRPRTFAVTTHAWRGTGPRPTVTTNR